MLAQEIFFTFLKIFLSFLGFSRVKIHFFQKVLKKWSSFRKKLLYYVSGVTGLTGSFTNNNENWKEVASQDIDFTDYINPKKLYDMILDHPIMAVVRVILTILSAIGGVGMIFNLTKHIFNNSLRCSPTFVIMKNSKRIERVRNRRKKIMMSDTESEYEDTNEDESDNEIHLKKRIISEAPPPYTS